MELRVDGRTLQLSQIGPDFLTLETAIDHPPCLATMWFSIDGREYEKEVRIPNGMTGESREVEIASP